MSRFFARIGHIPRQNTLSMTSLVKSHIAVFCISPTVPIDQAHAFFFFGELSPGIPYIPCLILSKRYLQRKLSESEAHKRTGASHPHILPRPIPVSSSQYMRHSTYDLLLSLSAHPCPRAPYPENDKSQKTSSLAQPAREGHSRKKRRTKWSENGLRGKL